MMVNTDELIGITAANQNFSQVVRVVDAKGRIIILKNNKPKYAVIDFNEYKQFRAYKEMVIDKATDKKNF